MRRAETVGEVGTWPLSRRDRAAMELALEALRAARFPRPGAVGLDEADIIDEVATASVQTASASLMCASSWAVAGEMRRDLRHAYARTTPRPLRARLALALRVLLRVDRGDWAGRHSAWCHQCDDVHVWHEPVRPLWQDPSCPAWDAAISPAQRRAEKRGG